MKPRQEIMRKFREQYPTWNVGETKETLEALIYCILDYLDEEQLREEETMRRAESDSLAFEKYNTDPHPLTEQ